MIKRAGVLALSAALLVVAAACSDDGGTTTTITTRPPGSQVTPNAVTGVGSLDALIVAAIGGDNIELAALTGYQKLGCTTSVTPADGVPKCREAETDGTQVEVLPASGCERTLVRPEQVPDAFRIALPGKDTEVLAAYRPKSQPSSFGGGFGAGEVVVMRTGQHPGGKPMGVALHVKDGRVVWLESDCDDLVTLIATERVDSFILGPIGLGTDPTIPPAATPPSDAPPADTP